MIRLGVVGHLGYEAVPAVLRELRELAPGLGVELLAEPDLQPSLGGVGALDDPASLDALLTLGGDGTLLRGARTLAGAPVPILGVNLGRLGFLTCAAADQLSSSLMRFARGDYEVEVRMMLDASVEGADGKVRARWFALNDVVIHKGGFARVVSLRVTADGNEIATYASDGIVFSTPTGSTAYSLSAGGPVVFPTLETILVTPVSAHTLAIRPVVLPATADVAVRADDGPAELLVTVDGQAGASFARGELLRVRRAEHGVHIVRFPGSTFFSTLQQKLGWGGLVDRDQTSRA